MKLTLCLLVVLSVCAICFFDVATSTVNASTGNGTTVASLEGNGTTKPSAGRGSGAPHQQTFVGPTELLLLSVATAVGARLLGRLSRA